MKKSPKASDAGSPGGRAVYDPRIVGEAIRALRRRAHLSQGELAARIGMRQGPVCNIEKGKNFPSAQVLIRLAAALDATVDEMLRPGHYARRACAPAVVAETETIEPYGAYDRPPPSFVVPGLLPTFVKPALPVGLPLTARVGTLAQDYLALEDLCRVPRQALIPLQIPFDLSPASLVRLASQMRGLFGVRSAVVFDYLELFENHGLRVVFTDLLGQAHSLSFYDTRHSNVFLFIEETLNAERQIFSLLYELGRVLLRAREGFPGRAAGVEESAGDKAARFFAASFLMPEDVVGDSVRQIGVRSDEWDLPLLLRLKHRFGVSAESFNYRLLELGLIAADAQADLRARIKAHYAKHAYGEPGQTRRILSPNGRLGDLLHTALRRGDPEAAEIAGRLKKLEVRMP